MDSPSKKRLRRSPPEEEKGPFNWDRHAEIYTIMFDFTNWPPELIKLMLEYVVRELVQGRVTLSVPFRLTNDIQLLSGGKFLIWPCYPNIVYLVRADDPCVVGQAVLPLDYGFDTPPCLQVDKDHVIFFQERKCCVWNFVQETVSSIFPTVIDNNEPVTIMHLDGVPFHGNRVFARKTPSSMEVLLLDISIQDEKPIFRVNLRTVAHAILITPLILGDKCMFEQDRPDYYCQLESKLAMQSWKFKPDLLPASRRWIKGCDDTYLLTFSDILERWDAAESKCYWSRWLERPAFNSMTFEIDSLTDSQLLVWSRSQTGPLAIVSKATGEAVYVEREPDFQVITCRDGTLIGRVGDDFQIIRFW